MHPERAVYTKQGESANDRIRRESEIRFEHTLIRRAGAKARADEWEFAKQGRALLFLC